MAVAVRALLARSTKDIHFLQNVHRKLTLACVTFPNKHGIGVCDSGWLRDVFTYCFDPGNLYVARAVPHDPGKS